MQQKTVKKKALVELHENVQDISKCYSCHLSEKISGMNENYGYLEPEEIMVNIA
jgi:hypothetical protein